MRARWVTGPYGHGAAFGLDLGLVLQYYVRWRWQLLRGRGGETPPT
jgi:hypothetical protein